MFHTVVDRHIERFSNSCILAQRLKNLNVTIITLTSTMGAFSGKPKKPAIRSKREDLDDEILRCLFSPRYMDFPTISRLRPVSTRFGRHFRKYCLSLRQFNLEIANGGYRQLNQCPCWQYLRLLETVACYCRNLEQVSGVLVSPESVNLATRSCLETMSRLTSVGLENRSVPRSSVFQLLSRLPNVTSMQLFGLSEDNRDEMYDEPAQLLDIAELKVENGRFWRLFRVESIRKLTVATGQRNAVSQQGQERKLSHHCLHQYRKARHEARRG